MADQVKEDDDGISFDWSDSQVLRLMRVLKTFHLRFGYNKPYDWEVVNKNFLASTGIDLTKHGKFVARNKVEDMKKLWKFWWVLRFNVRGAIWNKATGMVTLDDACWDYFKKTKQEEYLHFRTNGVDPKLCELWDDVFGNIFVRASTSFNEDMNSDGEGMNSDGESVESVESVESAESVVNGNDQNNYYFYDCFAVVERLVKDKLIDDESKLWCFTISKLGDISARQAFMEMPEDSMRVSWLKYEYDMTHKISNP